MSAGSKIVLSPAAKRAFAAFPHRQRNAIRSGLRQIAARESVRPRPIHRGGPIPKTYTFGDPDDNGDAVVAFFDHDARVLHVLGIGRA